MSIPRVLERVKWYPVPETIGPQVEPYATHAGALKVLGVVLRCYRLNTGEEIIHADDLRRLFADPELADTTDHGGAG